MIPSKKQIIIAKLLYNEKNKGVLMKKALLLCCATCVVCLNNINRTGIAVRKNNIESEIDASMRGFEVSNSWVYSSDVDFDQQTIRGSNYLYGYMDSWMGLYYYYYEQADELYVLLLSSVESKPNTNSSWDQYRWNTQQMKTEFSCSSYYGRYVNYSPKATSGTITTSAEVSVNTGTNGEEVELGTTISAGSSYSIPDIVISAESTSERQIGVVYNFINYSSNRSLTNICCSVVDRQSFAIFKIPNYSNSILERFTIKNTVSIYRYGRYNTSTLSGEQTYTFTLYNGVRYE